MSDLRIGIIGSGRWGKQHLEALRKTPGGVLVGLSARSPETCQTMEAEYGVPCYPDFHTLLMRTDVDAVIIATPNYLHYSMARAALAAGKHTLVEKPMSFTVAECDDLIQVAKEA